MRLRTCGCDDAFEQPGQADALAVADATFAFDASGHGRLAGQILRCMEAAVKRSANECSR